MIPTFHYRPDALFAVTLAGWLALTGAPGVYADELPRNNPASGAVRTRTPCVLLRNDNVLYGECHQRGDWIIVRSGDDSEIRLPRDQVACWAPSIRQLYRYRVDHRRSGDINVHLEDARWCLRYDLLDLAAQELRMIYRLDPDHAEAKQLEQRLRRLASRAPPRADSANTSSDASDDAGGDKRSVDDGSNDDRSDNDRSDNDNSGEDSPPEQASAAHEAGFDLATLQGFAGKVQPTLINRCGQCHSHNSDRQWRMIVPPGGTRASARMTRENLASLSPYLDLQAPLESELLQQALTPHGGGEPPLDPSDAAALEGLKSWLQETELASAPAKESSDALPAPRPRQSLPAMAPAVPMASAVPSRSSQPAGSADGIDNRPDSVPHLGPRLDQKSGQPARLPQVDNPFDPELFNRRYHATR